MNGSFTWMCTEDDIDYVLISPSDIVSILLQCRRQVFGPSEFSHAAQIHKHDTRVDSYKGSIVAKETFSLQKIQLTQRLIKWMPSESYIPVGRYIFGFRR